MSIDVYPNSRKPRTKWRLILDDILRDFDEGKFTGGMQFYTLEQVCDKYDISDITGRRVFNELRSRGLISSFGRRGTVVTGSTTPEEVYMCLPNTYFSCCGGIGQYHLLQQLTEGFSSDAYQQLFRIVPISISFLINHQENFAGKHVIVSTEALVDFSKRPHTLDMDLIAQLQEAFTPVFFDCYCKMPGYTHVGVDFYRGIRKVVQHLVDRGHTQIGYYTQDVNELWLQSRFKGFIDGLFAAGIRFDQRLLLMTTETLNRQLNLDALHQYMSSPQRPTAIICANDARAMYVMEYCREHGISVPDELAITGFDNIPESTLTPVPLTTVDSMKVKVARKILDLLSKRQLGKLKEPTDVWIDPELIVRSSS